MSPRGLQAEDKNLPLKPTPWTQEETEALHEMVQEYVWAKKFRKKAAWWIAWMLGVPGTFLLLWDQIEKLAKLFSWKVK